MEFITEDGITFLLPYSNVIRGETIWGATTPEDIVFLRECVEKLPLNAKILELGSFFGFSAIHMAEYSHVSTHVYCVDIWSTTLGAECLKYFQKSLYNLELEQRVHWLRMTTAEAFSILKDNSFDMVFVDAGHDYVDAKFDIIEALRVIKPGGILCGHDYPNIDGVVQAVHEIFGELPVVGGVCWKVPEERLCDYV